MGEDFGLSEAPVLLIYSGGGWFSLPCQRGNQNPVPHLPVQQWLPLHFKNDARWIWFF